MMKTLFNAVSVVLLATVEGSKRATEVLQKNAAVFGQLGDELAQTVEDTQNDFLESALPGAIQAFKAETASSTDAAMTIGFDVVAKVQLAVANAKKALGLTPEETEETEEQPKQTRSNRSAHSSSAEA